MERDRQGGWAYIMADRYRLDSLVWAEQAPSIIDGIAQEKRLKRWRCEWKFALTERGNPEWHDLYAHLV